MPARSASKWLVLAGLLSCWKGVVAWKDLLRGGLFERQGYVILRNFATAEVVQMLRNEMDSMLEAWKPELAGSGLAASLSLRKNATDHTYFLNSATQASFFVESHAIDDTCTPPVLKLPKKKAVRKIGHGIHLVSQVISNFVTSEDVAYVAYALGWRSPVVVQTVHRFNPPLALGVDRHQDSVTLTTDPISVVGMWLSLEDADETNGCLFVRPASHNESLRERLHRTSDGGLVFERLHNASQATKDEFVATRTRAGDLVVLHGLTEHYSPAGLDPGRSRESFQVHFVEADATWAPDNWLQYPDGLNFMKMPVADCAHCEEL